MSDAVAFVANHGPLVLINLPHRTDRRIEFGDQLRRIGLSYEHPGIRVFPAIRPSDTGGFRTIGARGCFLSHMTTLQDAVAAGEDSLIICEDDCDFSADFLIRLPAVMEVLARTDWDIFFGGYLSDKVDEIVDEDTGIFRLSSDHTFQYSHFYLVRGRSMSALVSYLEAILERPPGHPDGGPMDYDGALNHFRADRPDIVALAIVPPLGTQRPSRTDISELRWYDSTPIVRQIIQWLRRLRRR